jgi:membrane protein YqaA with SNARE-associated domain
VTAEAAVRVAGPVALMLALGLLSGLVPLVNAEALLIAAVVQAKGRWPALVVAVAVGQSGAKVLISLGARDGRTLLPSRLTTDATRGPARLHLARRTWPPGSTRRWWRPQADRVAELLRRPVTGSTLVLASAVGGIPPLAATSVVAGLARLRLTLFGITCLTGRLVRFTVIAIPVASWPYLTS